MLNYVIEQSEQFLQKESRKHRNKIGQFFTPKEIAKFMAKQFDVIHSTVTILDPGAGSGILSAAIIEHLLTFAHVKRIVLTLYESDSCILPLLKNNMTYIATNSRIPITYKIISGNYILSNIFQAQSNQNQFDIVIANPPYLKIPRNSIEAQAIPTVCYGAPNMYFLFLSMSIDQLKNEGQLSYIIPRSWTSGLYFSKFRKYLFSHCKINSFHLFKSRSNIFPNDKILQEVMILTLTKTKVEHNSVIISSTVSSTDFANIRYLKASYYDIVSNDDNNYVYLPTSKNELVTLKTVLSFKNTLVNSKLRLKTGLTVDFRNRELLSNTSGKGYVPLIKALHFNEGNISFPKSGHDIPQYVSTKKAGLVQVNVNYLLIKRFTSKEETRRLQVAVFLKNSLPEYEYISTDNKINYISSDNGEELPLNLLYGLYVIFNSTLYDQFYRVLNGSTQVNATEINCMPLPNKQKIISLGDSLIRANEMDTNTCDLILDSILKKDNIIDYQFVPVKYQTTI